MRPPSSPPLVLPLETDARLSRNSYIVLNLPYMILETVLTPSGTRAKTLRRILGTAFFATLGPLVYFYLEHKQKRVPGGTSLPPLFSERRLESYSY